MTIIHVSSKHIFFCRGATDNLYCLYLYFPHNLIDPHNCFGMLLRGQEKTRQVNQKRAFTNIIQNTNIKRNYKTLDC